MKIIDNPKETGAYKHVWDLRPLNEYLSIHKEPWKSIHKKCAKNLGYWKPNHNKNSKIEGWVSIPKTLEARVKLGKAMEAEGLKVQVEKTWLHSLPQFRRLF